MTSVGLFLCTLITITSAGHQFVASPTILEIGLAKKLQIECTATVDSTMTLTTQIRILFSNSTDQPIYDQLGAIDAKLGLYNNSGAVNSGKIVGKGASKLRLTWNYPRQDRAGVYKCEVRGQNADGVQETKSLTLNVSAVVPDQVSTLESIQTMASDLEKVKESLAEEKLKLSKLSGQIENGKSKFFRVSDVFQGRRYYLSAASNILVVEDAEAMCEIFGGYLVEVDRKEEHEFIATFLSAFTQYQLVLTGGSDEVMEDHWVNTYSQTPVKYINWGPGQPSAGRRENCLYLFKGYNWKMSDFKCLRGSNADFISAYLCEIEEIEE